MCTQYRLISFKILQFFSLLLLVSLPIWVIRFDVLVLKNNIPEQSATEYIEQLLLLGTALCYAYIGWGSRYHRRVAVLVSAFFSCMFIRELDSFFDQYIYHGFWVVPALIVAISAIGYALTDRKNTLLNLDEFLKNNNFSSLCLGLAILLVFSRLFGMGSFWHQVMGDDYIRIVKNIAEEGTELLGYTIIFYASVNYLISYLKIPMNNKYIKY